MGLPEDLNALSALDHDEGQHEPPLGFESNILRDFVTTVAADFPARSFQGIRQV